MSDKHLRLMTMNMALKVRPNICTQVNVLEKLGPIWNIKKAHNYFIERILTCI